MKTKITKKLFLGFALFLLGAFSVSAQVNTSASNEMGGGKGRATKQTKSEITLKQAGPVNIGGRVRALLCDKRDATGKTLYAGGVAGGLYRSTNGGNSWELLSGKISHAAVSCIAQDENGTVYVGTGEGFMNTTNSTIAKNNSTFASGKLGSGVFKTSSSTEAFDFVVMPGTAPDEDNYLNPAFDWAYVNELIYSNGYLYAATNTGISYYNNGVWTKSGVNKIAQDIKIVGDYIYFSTKDTDAKGFVIKRTTNADLSGAVEIFSINDTCVRGERFTTAFGRIELAVTQQDDQFIYASIADVYGNLAGIFLSENRGNKTEGNQSTWRKLSPDNNFTLFWNGNYSNTIIVDPNDKRSILCGSYVLQKGIDANMDNGYYYWDMISIPSTPIYWSDPAALVPADIYKDSTYLHECIHTILPYPTGTIDSFYVSNDGGIAFYGYYGRLTPSGAVRGFQVRNNGLNISQFFSVAVANDSSLVGGAQSNSSLYIAHPSEKATADVVVYPLAVEQPYPNVEGFISGGNVGASMFQRLSPGTRKAFFTSEPATTLARMYGDYYNFSNSQAWNFGSAYYPTDRITGSYYKEVTPSVLWETTKDASITDSIICRISSGMTIYRVNPEDSPILEKGGIIKAGDTIYVRSSPHFDYPFPYIFPNDYSLTIGEEAQDTASFMVKNPLQNRLFVGIERGNVGAIVMTNRPTDFSVVPETVFSGYGWGFEITAFDPQTEDLHCMAISKDGNTLFYTTDLLSGSRLYRITNMLNYTGNNPEYLIPYTKVIFNSTRHISSIALDPRDENNIMLTCENIDNAEANVLYSTDVMNSDSEAIQASFTSKTGNLPSRKMPVYTGIIEMHSSNTAFIGTDEGVYQTTNLSDASPTWNFVEGLKAPVYMIVQQTKNIAAANVGYTNAAGTTDMYSFRGTSLSGALYFATHGKGIYYCDDQQFLNPPVPGINVKVLKETTIQNTLKIYPNPVKNVANVEYTLSKPAKVSVKVIGLDGKILYQSDLGVKSKGTYVYTINCGNMPKGVSIVQIVTGNEVMTSKMIVQ